MNDNLTARIFLRIARSVIVRPVRVAAIIALAVLLCAAISLLSDWSDRASISLALKTVATPETTGHGPDPSPLPNPLPVYRDLLSSDAVLLRTLVVVDQPDLPGVVQWRKAHDAWEAGRTSETWSGLESALRHLDAEINRVRRDESLGPALLANLDCLSKRVEIMECGLETTWSLLKMSVSWPVKKGDIGRLAEILAKMARDRVQEVQMAAAHDASDFIRLRRERLRPSQLAPAEEALRLFAERELHSPADVVHLEQLSRSPAEADLPTVLKRMRQDLLATEAQRVEAKRLRRLLLESLPDVLWNGTPHQDNDGELTGPNAAAVGPQRLADSDPVLVERTLVIPREGLDRNVVLGRLKSREAELVLELNRLRSEFNPGYLGMADKRAELARTRREILTQVIGEAAQLQVSISILTARQTEIEQRIEATERQLNRLNGVLGRYQQLVQELDAARKRFYESWLDETQAMNLQQEGLIPAVLQVLDISGDYSGRQAALANPWRAAGIGASIGVVLAVIYALAASLLDHSLRWPDEVERHTGMRVLGRINKTGGRIVA